MDVRMQIEIQKILEYRDIFPNEALLDIDCILKKYNRDLLIRIVNALGMNYGNAYMPDTTLFSEKSALRVRELNERINNLEKEIQEKDKTIEKQESKKSVLNNLLDQANEVLEKID